MLVYLKNPMGYTTIDGKRVYGKKFAYGTFGPTDISIDAYEKYKDILEDAEYTKEWLENKYKANFPDIKFTINTIKNLDYKNLALLAKLVGVKYHKGVKRKITRAEKNALVRSIKLALSRGI